MGDEACCQTKAPPPHFASIQLLKGGSFAENEHGVTFIKPVKILLLEADYERKDTKVWSK